MGFLSEMTMVQRAGGAAVLVLILVMLLVKQRQAQGASATKGEKTAKAAKAPKSSKKAASAPKEKKGRSFTSKRKSKDDAGDALDSRIAEPKAGRMVPRLPSPSDHVDVADVPMMEPVGSHESVEPVFAEVAPVAHGSESPESMISEPGWPTPGEVWAAPDAAVSEQPVEVNSWQTDTEDDALAALTEVPEADTTEWATDAAAATGWETPVVEAAPAAESDATWQAEEETFDWTAGDPIEGWATADAEAETVTEAAEEPVSVEAAWETPEDDAPSWEAGSPSEWAAAEVVEEPAMVATAVAEEFTVGEWDTPVAESEPAAEDVPQIVWDPVDEVEEIEDEPVAEVVVPEPVEVEAEVVAEPMVETQVAEVEPVVEAPVAELVEEPVVEGEPVVAVETVEVEPAVEAAPEVELVMATAAAEPADEMVAPAVVVDEPVVEVAAVHAVEMTPVAEVTVAPVFVDPAARWASMAPGGVTETRQANNPTESWARMRPGRTAVAVNGGGRYAESSSNVAVAPAPSLPQPVEATSPSLAWWDVPSEMVSDPRRGRFALGGYALQPGHQVVSGVTFRDGVVPPPTHWVIGPVVGAVAPGTLVLHVDGCLNCRPEDLAVLMDPGFAPTTDGFSLRLVGAATGPFAASGTYTIS